MKNAFVLVHHVGDDGNVTEGMILEDVSDQRFRELEKRGLVREATAAEVKAGHQPQIERSEVKFDGEVGIAPEGGEKQAKQPANKKAAEPANKAQ